MTTMTSDFIDFRIGETLGEYKILGFLGSGGMGKVYQVRNTLSEHTEAMKVLLPGLTLSPEFMKRFFQRARISAGLAHPNIATLRTAQRIDNQVAVLMEFVQGSTFDVLMNSARITIQNAVYYASQALCGLSYAHSLGAVHGDITPRNLMLTPEGTVKLMDFGITRPVGDPSLTYTGVPLGAVYYMSPEQVEGRRLDARSDIYSLGVTLYQMVTGQRPFDGADEKQIMDAHLTGTPRPPRLVNRAIPSELNDVILVAIAKDPEQRFQTAAAFQGALSRVSARLGKGADVQNAPVSPAADSSPFIGRKFSYVSLNILALIAVGLVAAKMELPKYWHRYNSVQAAPVKTDTPAVTPLPVPAELPKPVSRRVRSQPPPQAVTASARRAQPASQAGSTQAPARDAAAQSANGGSAGVQVRMRVLATRVAVASTAIRTLQNEQAVPADILATDQRLNSEMNQAKASLDQNDATTASAELNAAERDLERIETFLRK